MLSLSRPLRLQSEFDKPADGFRQIGNGLLLCPPRLYVGKHLLGKADHLLYGVGLRSSNHFAYA